MSHLTYAEAVITGLIQGVTELFPVSSLGHNVLLPALIGGQWAKDLSVSAPGSPYLAFIVGLHVATALAMITYFWRDWVRIVRGFVSSIRRRQIVTPDQRLAWMIVLATIPVGIAGAALQKVFVNVFAKPELTAVFLAVNGLILMYCERQRRARAGRGAAGHAAAATAGTPAVAGSSPLGAGPSYGGPSYGPAAQGGPAQGVYEGYSQQPWQQQWQGPDPRYGQDDWQNGPDARYGSDGRYGQDPWPGQAPQYGQASQYGQAAPEHAQASQYGQAPWDSDDTWGGQDQWDGRTSRDAHDPWGGQDDRTVGGLRLTEEPDRRRAAHRAAESPAPQTEAAVAADGRLSVMGWGKAILVGSAQILALLPGISRDGIVTVAGMGRGLSREDAVRFSFLLSAPVILAAGLLKAHDLLGPAGKGIHGPVLVGSLLSGVGAYLSVRFLTRYFSESRSLTPFGIYCLAAGLLSLGYLLIK